jgi:hypothetical protein
MFGLAMRLRGVGAVIDFENEYVVRILLRNRDIEFAAARLLDGGRAVFLERRKIAVDLAGHDIDGVDVKRRRLRRNLVAAHGQKDPCRSGDSNGSRGGRD